MCSSWSIFVVEMVEMVWLEGEGFKVGQCKTITHTYVYHVEFVCCVRTTRNGLECGQARIRACL